jgi:ribonuclease HII
MSTKTVCCLLPAYLTTLSSSNNSTNSHTNANTFEIGVDEVGILGRVYTAAVILPKDSPTFQYHLLKNSKRFHSESRIQEVSDYIKAHALAWHISFCSVDEMNIRQATLRSMRDSITQVINKHEAQSALAQSRNYLLLIDGDDFQPFYKFVLQHQQLAEVPHVCIEGGDDKFCSIAAASILAKVAQDAYITELRNL